MSTTPLPFNGYYYEADGATPANMTAVIQPSGDPTLVAAGRVCQNGTQLQVVVSSTDTRVVIPCDPPLAETTDYTIEVQFVPAGTDPAAVDWSDTASIRSLIIPTVQTVITKAYVDENGNMPITWNAVPQEWNVSGYSCGYTIYVQASGGSKQGYGAGTGTSTAITLYGPFTATEYNVTILWLMIENGGDGNCQGPASPIYEITSQETPLSIDAYYYLAQGETLANVTAVVPPATSAGSVAAGRLSQNGVTLQTVVSETDTQVIIPLDAPLASTPDYTVDVQYVPAGTDPATIDWSNAAIMRSIMVVTVQTSVTSAVIDASGNMDLAWNAVPSDWDVAGYAFAYTLILQPEIGEAVNYPTDTTATAATLAGPFSPGNYEISVLWALTDGDGNSQGPASSNYPISVGAAPAITLVQNNPASFAANMMSIGAASVGETPYAFFYDDLGSLWTNYWNGIAWQWINFGTPPGALITLPIGVTVADGSAYVFVLCDDQDVWLNIQAAGTGEWSNLGRPEQNTPAVRGMGATTLADNGGPSRIDAVVFADDEKIWENYSNGYFWGWSPDGMPATGVGASVGVVAISSQINMFYLTRDDNHLFLTTWDAVTGLAFWIDCGVPPGTTIAKPIGATSDGLNYSAFVAGTDGHLWCYASSSSGSIWIDLGPPLNASVISPIGVTTVMTLINPEHYAYGELNNVFVLGNDGNAWLCQENPDETWTWFSQGKPAGATISNGCGATAGLLSSGGPTNLPFAFCQTSDGNIWMNWSNNGTWEWSNQGGPDNALTVDWSPVANFSGEYEITLQAIGQTDTVLTTSQLTCSFVTAEPLGEGYSVSARTVVTNNGAPVYGTASPSYDVLTSAPSWTLIAYDDGVMSLTWTADPEITVDGYLVSVNGLPTPDYAFGNVTTGDIDATLQPGESYSATIRATAGGIVQGPPSTSLAPLTTAPTQVRLGSTITSNLILSWANSTDSNVSGYSAELKANGVVVQTITPAISPQIFTPPFAPRTVYSAAVRETGALTEGPWASAAGPYQDTQTYVYDDQGRVSSIAWAGGFTETYQYDSAGNLLSANYTETPTPEDALSAEG